MEFRDEYYFLSNMYPVKMPLNIRGNSYVFDCLEAAFQAMKCPERAGEFVGLNGYKAKTLGRTVELRKDWNEVKEQIMFALLKAKFSIPELREMLNNTPEEIAEDNDWHDTFWGVYYGEGKNVLGKMLMLIRDGNYLRWNLEAVCEYMNEKEGCKAYRVKDGNIYENGVFEKPIFPERYIRSIKDRRTMYKYSGSRENVKGAVREHTMIRCNNDVIDVFNHSMTEYDIVDEDYFGIAKDSKGRFYTA